MAESKGMKKARKSEGQKSAQRNRTLHNKARQLRKRYARAEKYGRKAEMASISASLKAL